MNTTKTLKDQWRNICNKYLFDFCHKHDFSLNYQYDIVDGFVWIGGDPGTIANVCDMFISMDDIRYDIDNDIDEEMFQKWYWRNQDHYELGLKYMNYPSFCKGAPEPYTDKQLEDLRELSVKVRDTRTELDKMINDMGGDPKLAMY